jgi:hypothetical protein
MKSKRCVNYKNRKSRKNKRGGFFSKNKNIPLAAECDPNDLPNITDQNELREKYLKCCPKNMFGQKNKTPYCKQIDLNWSSKEQLRRDVTGYYGDETDVNKIKQIMNAPVEGEVKKSWWKFWGGKTRRAHGRNRKFSRRNIRK